MRDTGDMAWYFPPSDMKAADLSSPGAQANGCGADQSPAPALEEPIAHLQRAGACAGFVRIALVEKRLVTEDDGNGV